MSATNSIAWLLNLRGGDVPFNPLLLSFALLHADGGVELFLDLRKLAPGQNLGNEVSLQPIAGFHDALDRLGAGSVRSWSTRASPATACSSACGRPAPG